VGDRREQVKHSLWLEVDRGTEHLGTIQEKCSRYWQAYQMWPHDFFPLVAFVVPDMQRVRELKGVMSAGPQGSSDLFDAYPTQFLTAVVTHGGK